jgi:hypothetical protein
VGGEEQVEMSTEGELYIFQKKNQEKRAFWHLPTPPSLPLGVCVCKCVGREAAEAVVARELSLLEDQDTV